MKIDFKELDIVRHSDAVVRQLEVVIDDIESGMILEVRSITDYGVRVFLWMRLNDIVLDVGSVLDEEGKDLNHVKKHVRENLVDMIETCISELEILSGEVEEAEIRMSKLTKLVGGSEDSA